MSNKRYALIVLAVTALVASILACNPPKQTGPKPAPDTVTPYVPATAQSQDAPTPIPPPSTDMPGESAPTDTPVEPTETLTPPPPTSAPAPTPTPPVSEGPLDFEEPRWVHAWERREGGGVWVTVKVKIVGGAPPFKIYYDGDLHGESTEREYLLKFAAAGCGQIAHNIVVESADGQSKSHDFWLGGDKLPWCD